jgi:hypothetical protein
LLKDGVKQAGSFDATPQAANPEMRPLAERLLAVKFAREYIRNGFNGTEAVIATIPGKRTRAAAGVAAHKLVANPMVQEAMRRELRAIDSLNEVDMEYLIRSFRSIAEASVFDYGIKIVNGRGDFTDFNHELLTLDQKANLREITFHDNGAVKTIRLASRERALDALMDAKVRAEENATGAGMDTLKARLRAAQARIPLLPKKCRGTSMKSKTKKPDPVRKLQRKLRDCYAALASSRERNQKLANEIFEGRLARDRVGRELDEVREAMLREAVRAGKESREHLEHLEQIAAQRMEIDQLNAAVTSLKATVGDEQRAAAKAVAEAKWLEGQLAKANTAAAIISGALRVAVERVDEQRAQIEEIRAHGRQ